MQKWHLEEIKVLKLINWYFCPIKKLSTKRAILSVQRMEQMTRNSRILDCCGWSWLIIFKHFKKSLCLCNMKLLNYRKEFYSTKLIFFLNSSEFKFASQNDLIFMKVFMISSTLNKAVLLIRFVKRAYLLRSVKLGSYSSFNPCQLRFSFRIIMNGGKGLLTNSCVEWYTGLMVSHVKF